MAQVVPGLSRGPVWLQTETGWLAFEPAVGEAAAWRLDEVRRAIAVAEAALASGLAVTAAVAYEAAPAFEPAAQVRPADPRLPLAWFGFHRDWHAVEAPPAAPAPRLGRRRPSVDRAAYGRAIAAVKAAIAAGETYQINYTLRLRAAFAGQPLGLLPRLAARGGCGGYLELGDLAIVCGSPELLLACDGDRLTSRPMKGTRPRGRWSAEDQALAAELAESAKDRAENLMILDMVRNDLGRLAPAGGVHVPAAFQIERWPTVWQMTSTVTAEAPGAGLDAILAAAFPPASITGAPKLAAMNLIARLETEPRGLYTGTLGYRLPDGRGRLGVAIRTAVIDRAAGVLEYGVGGGIVWDSTAAGEWAEAAVKARALRPRRERFELLETLAWDPAAGWRLGDGHLARLAASAACFDRPCDLDAVRAALDHAAANWAEPRRVRLVLAADGAPRIESGPLPPPPARPWRLGLAATPVDPRDRLLYHKTTRRGLYQRARAERPDCDDVLLANRAGQVTESTIANVVFRRGGRLWTPPVACGLLPGVQRAALLAAGEVAEGVLRVAELPEIEALWLVNSVRGWIEAVYVRPSSAA
jgi:para-aminobenzoate synthetase/4-amino-4-deoxychorismate lyase